MAAYAQPGAGGSRSLSGSPGELAERTEGGPTKRTDEEDDEEESEEDDAEDEEDDEEREMSYPEQVGAWGGLAPLHHAVRQGHVEAALTLLEAGADIDQTIADGSTPLLMASLNGQWDLASILVERGADPTIAASAGTTPLYAVLEREWESHAAYSHPTEHQRQETNYLQMMERLLDAGADPDARLNRHLWYMEYTFRVLGGSGINLKGARRRSGGPRTRSISQPYVC